MSDKPTAIGLIGLGAISTYYIAALGHESRGVLRAVCDVDHAKLAAFGAGGPRRCDDAMALLAAPDVDAVIIAAPNDEHYRLAKAALLAGKHVCCEKPLTPRADQARELCALSRRLGLTLLTVFHRRYNVHVRGLRDLIPAAALIDHVRIDYRERIDDHAGGAAWYGMPDRCGGGCIADNGPNVYDTLAFLLGRLDVVDVAAEHSARGFDVRAELTLRSTDGVRVTAALDWDYPHGEKKDVEVVLRDGTRLRADMLAGFSGYKSSLFHEYAAAVADFVTHVRDRAGRGEDGLAAAAFVDAAYALLRGRTATAAPEPLVRS